MDHIYEPKQKHAKFSSKIYLTLFDILPVSQIISLSDLIKKTLTIPSLVNHVPTVLLPPPVTRYPDDLQLLIATRTECTATGETTERRTASLSDVLLSSIVTTLAQWRTADGR